MAMAGGEQWIAAGSSEIILEGFVFSLALPTVLLNYSAGVPTVRLSPPRAAGRETLFCYKGYGARCLLKGFQRYSYWQGCVLCIFVQPAKSNLHVPSDVITMLF